MFYEVKDVEGGGKLTDVKDGVANAKSSRRL